MACRGYCLGRGMAVHTEVLKFLRNKQSWQVRVCGKENLSWKSTNLWSIKRYWITETLNVYFMEEFYLFFFFLAEVGASWRYYSGERFCKKFACLLLSVFLSVSCLLGSLMDASHGLTGYLNCATAGLLQLHQSPFSDWNISSRKRNWAKEHVQGQMSLGR